MWEFLKQLLHARPRPIDEAQDPSVPLQAPRSGLLDNFKAEEAGDAEDDAMPDSKHEKKESKKQEKKEHKGKRDVDDERSEAAFETLTGKKK